MGMLIRGRVVTALFADVVASLARSARGSVISVTTSMLWRRADEKRVKLSYRDFRYLHVALRGIAEFHMKDRHVSRYALPLNEQYRVIYLNKELFAKILMHNIVAAELAAAVRLRDHILPYAYGNSLFSRSLQ